MRARVVAAAVLVLAACGTSEPDTEPFRINAVREGIGPLEQGVTEEWSVLALDGTAHRDGGTTLVLTDTALPEGGSLGTVTIRFSSSGAPQVVFPAQLEGQRAHVMLLIDPTMTGPEGEPLPIPGVRVSVGTAPDLRNQFILFERSYEPSSASEQVFSVGPTDVTDDVPWFQLVQDWAEWEPSECGIAYYDALRVLGDVDEFVLRRGEQRSMQVGTDASQPPWKVLNALSWHRRGTCTHQAKAWAQLAAWR